VVNEEEFQQLKDRVRELEALEFTHIRLAKQYKEPARPREGMLAYADGTAWNPGSGLGVYQYRGSAWVLL